MLVADIRLPVARNCLADGNIVDRMARKNTPQTPKVIEQTSHVSKKNATTTVYLKDTATRPEHSRDLLASSSELRYRSIGFVRESRLGSDEETRHDLPEPQTRSEARPTAHSKHTDQLNLDNHIEKPQESRAPLPVKPANDTAAPASTTSIRALRESTEDLVLFEGRANTSRRQPIQNAYEAVQNPENSKAQRSSSTQCSSKHGFPRNNESRDTNQHVNTASSTEKITQDPEHLEGASSFTYFEASQNSEEATEITDEALDDYILNAKSYGMILESTVTTFDQDVKQFSLEGECDPNSSDNHDSYESLMDEEDLYERKLNNLADEKLAQLLTKQDELGFDAESLLLVDGSDYEKAGDMENDYLWDKTDEDDDNGDDENAGVRGVKNPNGHQKWNHQTIHTRIFRSDGEAQSQPSESTSGNLFRKSMKSVSGARSVMINGYDFDVTDRERASISRKSTSRPFIRHDFALSDLELEEELRAAWSMDRKRKGERKLHREKLRLQGLLGKGKNSENKILLGDRELTTVEDIGAIVEEFLLGKTQSVALPPMDKFTRKIVHEVANAFKIKSSSQGSGSSRFTVLYKTKRTISFNEGIFERLQRRYSGRMKSGGAADVRSGRSKISFNGSRPPKHVGYLDGEIVGAAAPELSAENRGRAMLEKMGWSSGTALGAVNNKGILQPVVHVVKTSKSGLG